MANIQNETLSKANGSLQDLKNRNFSPEEKLEKMTSEAGEKVGAIASNLAAKTSLYVKNSRAYIEENPGKSIAIAAGVGLLTGSLLTLAMRNRR